MHLRVIIQEIDEFSLCALGSAVAVKQETEILFMRHNMDVADNFLDLCCQVGGTVVAENDFIRHILCMIKDGLQAVVGIAKLIIDRDDNGYSGFIKHREHQRLIV